MEKILLTSLRADHGGGPQHVNSLVENLLIDFEIFVACPNDEPYYAMWKKTQRVKKIFILPHRKFRLKKLLELNKFIKENDIKIVHSHGKGAGIYARLLKIINWHLKIVHTLHGVHVEQYGFLKRNLYITIEKLLSLFTDKFINVSSGEQQLCLNYGIFAKKKSCVIYNGIRQVIFDKYAKSSLNLTGKKVIATISRFDYQKNMDLAYEIAKCFKDNTQLVFLWIGDGGDRARLKAWAERDKVNIVFTGFTNKIPMYLSASDIYLSTSRWEGLPYALIEAQSLGLPIVATNVVGNNEVVQDKQDGFLFDDLREACKHIDLLLHDETTYENFSAAAKLNFKSKFDIKIMIDKIEEIYKELQ
ncbi:glycosyltransferase [Campylobacter mucosalis]|uniref:glycosyltransferase n=1 Tax=Campylobacter mucosalis TaxID=202 RepID=UPI00147006BE|nr:glycosyltransferase [Campylobacter mucosalis]